MEGQTSPLLQIPDSEPDHRLHERRWTPPQVSPAFPASFYSIPAQVVWPYMQQWHLDVQHELPAHIVTTFSYVGSKGTHLGRQRDLNQLFPTPAARIRTCLASRSVEDSTQSRVIRYMMTAVRLQPQRRRSYRTGCHQSILLLAVATLTPSVHSTALPRSLD